MKTMKKETRGRKPLPEKEKKQPISIMVKGKFVNEVKSKIKEIERLSQEIKLFSRFFKRN